MLFFSVVRSKSIVRILLASLTDIAIVTSRANLHLRVAHDK
jgi:hypothetical protein